MTSPWFPPRSSLQRQQPSSKRQQTLYTKFLAPESQADAEIASQQKNLSPENNIVEQDLIFVEKHRNKISL